ncbi:MAG: hypothetical protein ACE5WD_03295 [Candidatus Aminicenantia bacterium]
MKECKKFKKNLISFYYRELSSKSILLMENHLKSCSYCRQEFHRLKQILDGAGIFKQEIEEEINSINWTEVPSIIIDRIKQKEFSFEKKSFFPNLKNLLSFSSWRPIAASFAGLFIIVILCVLILIRPFDREKTREEFYISPIFFDQMESSIAKNEALDYLKQSQIVLMDIMKLTQNDRIEPWRIRLNSEKARDLLAKKKYLNQELNKFEMARAKKLCRKIEFIFYEVSLLDEQPSLVQLERIRELLRKEQLLLKIRLVEKELENEV